MEGKPSAQSEVLSTMEKVFVQDIPVLGRIHLSLDCNQSSCPCSWKTPPQHDAASTMLHCWDCIGQVMSSAWFSPHIPLRIKAKKFYLGLIRHQTENFICHHLGVLQVFLGKLHAGFHVSCTEERLPSGHSVFSKGKIFEQLHYISLMQALQRLRKTVLGRVVELLILWGVRAPIALILFFLFIAQLKISYKIRERRLYL